MKLKRIQHLFVLMIALGVFLTHTETAFAQSFKFQLVNINQQITVGSTFQVRIMIESGGQQTINGDALINFDPNKVSFDTTPVSGNFFTYFSATPLAGTNNQYLVSSWEESVAHAKAATTDTLFATMTLTAKAAGSTSLSFECTSGSEADSNINRASDSQDILTNCSALTPLSLTFAAAGNPTAGPSPTTVSTTVSPTNTPAAGVPTATPVAASPTQAPSVTPLPTSTPAASATPTPTAIQTTPTPRPSVAVLPRAGMTSMTIIGLGIGGLLTVMGALFIL